MADLIRIKRGLKSRIPALMQGEFGFCTDTEEVFIGGLNGNVLISGRGDAYTGIFNVKTMYGAKGDGVADDYTAIKKAIDDVVSSGGGIVYFPKGTYLIGNTLSWTGNNVSFAGAGRDITILRDHATLGNKRIIHLTGTQGNTIKNTSFSSMTFRNGTAQTIGEGNVGKDCIRLEYVDGVSVTECRFTEIQGIYGLVTKRSKNIDVRDSYFYRWTNSAFVVLNDCENINVIQNEFDTCTSTDIANSYAFATGGETTNDGIFFCKNLMVKRNIIRNNPRWEGLDCHGGENIFFIGNYIENVAMGISIGCSDGIVSNPILKNIHVKENTIIQGTGRDNFSGIVISGSSSAAVMGEDIYVEENTVIGFGEITGSTANIGSISVYDVKNVHLVRNTIDYYAQSAIALYYNVRGSKINGNHFKNARGGGSPSEIVCIYFREGCTFGAEITNNVVDPESSAQAPKYFIKAMNIPFHAQIENNQINHVVTSLYIGNPLPVEQASAAVPDFVGKYGDKVYNQSGKVGWTVTAPKQGYGSKITSVIVLGTINAGSNVLNFVNSTGNFRWLPEGMNITIAGAGAGGTALNTRVLKNNRTSVILADNAGSSVANANVTYQTCTIV